MWHNDRTDFLWVETVPGTKIMIRKIILFISLLLFCVVSVSFAQELWDFENVSAGGLPKDFISTTGEWGITEDGNGSSHSFVLAQLAENTGMTFNSVLIGHKKYKNIDIAVHMRSVSGTEDQGGGLIWRARDENNYYIARYNPLEDNYRVYKVVDGRRLQLQSANIKRSPGWHKLRIVMTDDHIQCYYDGKKYLDINDRTFAQEGTIGLWTKADAVTYFDDLTVAQKK